MHLPGLLLLISLSPGQQYQHGCQVKARLVACQPASHTSIHVSERCGLLENGALVVCNDTAGLVTDDRARVIAYSSDGEGAIANIENDHIA